ncbi:hypothetical protein COK25_08345 [Bacillus cereus]|uniref:DUF1064 domain-containing protein n=1 Tax=Bacillus cereus TaxID=1396 RepID=UPI000BF8ADCC|nr:DUF1064 domain-containing protein [Bacillus cereus]PEX52509.1 hypothetical protein CN456_18385 [Bacillus cereus]PEZ87587.1 hypothetical protein CN376_23705 [Bacillus cereus]PFF03937.1 hypothetical protein CN323_06010 [Bacillus cereus]PFQ56758.1 hypothetical protein COK25_08345 [Bacillus cereus]
MNKYNAKKVEVDGIIFHSKAESDYYSGLKIWQAAGEITSFELQPRFTLQPAFAKNGKSFKAITYIADFMVYLPNGDVEVVDIKGMVTETFAVKKKMFEYKYPHLQLILLKHVIKYGGFITLDEYNKLKREEKKLKKAK